MHHNQRRFIVKSPAAAAEVEVVGVQALVNGGDLRQDAVELLGIRQWRIVFLEAGHGIRWRCPSAGL